MSSDISFNTTDNPVVIGLLTVFLFMAGAGMAAVGVMEYQETRDLLEDAEEVEATIVAVEIDIEEGIGADGGISDRTSHEFDDDTTFYLHIEFEYEYDGVERSSTNFDAVGSIPSYNEWEDAQEASEEYSVGDRETAFVPPDDPDEAFLEGDMPFTVYGLIGFGVLLLVASVFLPIAFRFDIGRS